MSNEFKRTTEAPNIDSPHPSIVSFTLETDYNGSTVKVDSMYSGVSLCVRKGDQFGLVTLDPEQVDALIVALIEARQEGAKRYKRYKANVAAGTSDHSTMHLT